MRWWTTLTLGRINHGMGWAPRSFRKVRCQWFQVTPSKREVCDPSCSSSTLKPYQSSYKLLWNHISVISVIIFQFIDFQYFSIEESVISVIIIAMIFPWFFHDFHSINIDIDIQKSWIDPRDREVLQHMEPFGLDEEIPVAFGDRQKWCMNIVWTWIYLYIYSIYIYIVYDVWYSM